MKVKNTTVLQDIEVYIVTSTDKKPG